MIIAISTQKGGVLKTTLSTHLASVLALKQKKVLIVDTDSQSNVAVTFNINADKLKYTLYDVLMEDIPAEMAILNVYDRDSGVIDILPSTNSLMMFTEGTIKAGKFNVLKDKMKHLDRYYDYILIDTPPSLGLMIGNVLAIADKVIVPFQPEQYSRRSLTNILDTIDDFKEKINPNLSVMGVIATIVESRTNLHTDIIQSTRQLCDKRNIKMIDTVIPKSIRYASSIGYAGKPLILDKPNNEMSKLYFTIWGELNNEQQ